MIKKNGRRKIKNQPNMGTFVWQRDNLIKKQTKINYEAWFLKYIFLIEKIEVKSNYMF